MSDDTTVMSLRLSKGLATQVATVARVERVSISETIRAAVYRYVTARGTDERFTKLLTERLEEDRELLERVAKEGLGGTL